MTFRAMKPIDGTPFGDEIAEHSQSDVTQVIQKAENVAHELAKLSPAEHAKLLRTIGVHIETARDQLVATACAETALAEGRIGGEITRTTVQFNRFAELVETGEHLKVVIDKANPDYSPAPRPDIRKMNQPLGVVAIFAASNFPLAFSVAGGDAASAIAAGNAVVAKAHPSHPNTCAIIEKCVKGALKECGISENAFSIVQGVNPQITHWLALDPLVQAIGFTGSETVGRILVDLAASREVPIPVFAEMGSLNPLFITSTAITERSEALAKGLVDSALMGSGQFCTKPGLVFVPDDAQFMSTIKSYLSTMAVAPLLSKSIADRYSNAIADLAKITGVEVLSGTASSEGFGVTPTFFITDWKTAQANPHLLEEHFGPTTVIIKSAQENFVAIAQSLSGQLTSTIQGTDNDQVDPLIAALSQKSGRVIWNGFPTGVAVTAAMTHGGPWPSSSTHTTSVGVDAIYRFMRPVSYQGLPQQALPAALQDANPWKVPQRIN
jgi:alpha-ketoglutaric semialdehyde dehydrogenase